MEEGKKKRSKLNGSFVTGAIALVFLIIGYEVALFVHRAASLRIEANRDHPDTVYVIDRELAAELLAGSFALSPGAGAPSVADNKADAPSGAPASGRTKLPAGPVVIRKNAPHSPAVRAVRAERRRIESFRFNPNTVSVEDLQRLGFSEKQAQSIDNYRQKGGRFRRPSDFAKSYVVADSVYERLAPFIDIPRLDINRADSTALLALPGIGPWFAGRIVAYRTRLGGFSHPEQLLEIYRFDRERYDGLSDLITCTAPEPYPLWTLPEAELARHPYLTREEAHGVVLYRSHQPREACTLEGLKKAGVLSEEHAGKWNRCRIAAP